VAGFLTRGQPAALEAISRAVRNERPPQALLLNGPVGVGKTTLALDLAAGLLCLAADPADRPCRACPACRKVEHGNHPDLHRLAPVGPGQQIPVKLVRTLESDLALLPMEGRWRIAIVEAADRLNDDAQGALLKLLEEPPTGAVIVLAAADTAQLRDTIISRCSRIRLGPVSQSGLAGIAIDAGLADPSRAAMLARVAGGQPRRVLALARDPEAEIVESSLLRQLLDLLGGDRRTRLAAVRGPGGLLAQAADLDRRESSAEEDMPVSVMDDAEDGDAADADRAASRSKPSAAQRRRNALRLFEAWRDLCRDLALVVGAGPAGAAHGVRRLDLLEELATASVGLDRAGMAAFLERLDSFAAAVEAYASPELAVDVLALAWPRPAATS
jgi:DNA polymerase III delta' subunit